MSTAPTAPTDRDRDRDRAHLVGLGMALAGAIAFSGKAIIAKLSYRYGVDAITVVMFRMLFALPLFLALGWWGSRGRPPLSGRDRLTILALGFTGYYLASTLDFAGLQDISASLERLILYLNPTLVLGLGVVLHGLKVKPRQLWALGLSYSGVLLVFGHEVRFSGEHAVRGALLVFGSAVSYAIYLVHSGQVVARIGALRLTGWATAVACALCIAQFLVLRPLSAAQVAPEVLQLAALNAVACTFAPVLLVMLAIERVGASVAAQTGMVGPIATIALGVLLLGEPINAWIIAGTVLVMGGVWLLARLR